jgi:hypothetical protein
MITINIRHTSNDTSEIVTNIKGLIMILSTLEESRLVKSYIVCRSGSFQKQESFGYGGFEKWVMNNFPENTEE